MDKSVQIQYWLDGSKADYETMLHNFHNSDYNWSLFIGHLVIEKLLKALYINNVDSHPPRTHDLLRLANLASIPTTEEQNDLLEAITQFNLKSVST